MEKKLIARQADQKLAAAMDAIEAPISDFVHATEAHKDSHHPLNQGVAEVLKQLSKMAEGTRQSDAVAVVGAVKAIAAELPSVIEQVCYLAYLMLNDGKRKNAYYLGRPTK